MKTARETIRTLFHFAANEDPNEKQAPQTDAAKSNGWSSCRLRLLLHLLLRLLLSLSVDGVSHSHSLSIPASLLLLPYLLLCITDSCVELCSSSPAHPFDRNPAPSQSLPGQDFHSFYSLVLFFSERWRSCLCLSKVFLTFSRRFHQHQYFCHLS